MSDSKYVMRWTGKGWTAQIVENEDGGGWAVAMTRDGDREPTLVVPWVMGRNKKDPKPLNQLDFNSQVKAAQDFVDRREQQRRMAYRVSRDVVTKNGEWLRVIYDVIPDEYDPSAELVALNRAKEEVARATCPIGFNLTRETALAWANGGFEDIYGGGGW